MTNDLLPVLSEVCFQRTVTLVIFLFQSCSSWYPVRSESTKDFISLDQTQLMLEQGTTGDVTCSLRKGETGAVTWVDPLGQPVSVSNRSRIHYDRDTGRLMLTHANVSDSGYYICAFNLTEGCRDADAGRRCNVTLDCRVYAMPAYLIDGIVILVINGVLLAILVACFIHSKVYDQRLRKYGLQKL